MKKLIALIAVVVLFTASAFAATVTNNATVTVKCKTMEFTCNGPIALADLLADGGTSTVHGTTIWTITNWGTTGSFTCDYPTPLDPTSLFVITPPSGGAATDIHVVGGTWSNSASLSGGGTWYFQGQNCDITGSISYDFDVWAETYAVSGTYSIAFTLDFVAL
jgi:type 1 fimbria pilin